MFSSRVAEALTLALDLHRDQRRKGTDIPYVGHLMAVAALVAEHGGSEDQVIAALLHDAIEDQGDRITAEGIAARFGEQVAAIVVACSDTDVQPKPPWRERKERYIAHLDAAPPAALLVSCADKLHNAQAILGDLREIGPAMLTRFNVGPSEILWYYRALADRFLALMPSRIARELARAVGELERSLGASASAP